jgi:hypothetical protein
VSTALVDLQRTVQSHLLGGGVLPGTLRDAVRGPADERWRIYSDAYRLRLVDGLKEAYPAFVRRLGDDTAAALLLDFVNATPSTHRSLRDYGEGLAEHLARDAADAPGSELHLVSELAAFEWALAGAYDAADARAVTHDDLAHVAGEGWATLRFGAAPCVRRVRFVTNAPEAWRAAIAARDASAAPAVTGAPDGGAATPASSHVDEPPPVRLEEAPVDWLIWRDGFDTRFRWMEPAEAAAFDACIDGESFGELCERLAIDDEEGAALRAATWLKAWTEDGLLVSV